MEEHADQHTDELPADLDVTGMVGPYVFPDNSRRRIPGYTYLALAAALGAGLDGIKNQMQPPAPVNKNIYAMSARERSRSKIGTLPGDLNEAIAALEKDEVIREALGSHIANHFIDAKKQEWSEYIAQVHDWELQRYLGTY